jgi:hypothetical protein
MMVDKTNTAPNPFDPAALRISGGFAANGGAEKLLLILPVQKPNRQSFVRVHPSPELRIPLALLELKEERETYVVAPNVAEQIPGEVRRVEIRLGVTQQGSAFLWPVPLPAYEHAENSWNLTARSAADRAESAWVRLTPNMGAQCYDVHVAQSAAADPVWPDKTLQELLAIAFGNGRLIDNLEHPVIQRLLGRG